MGKEKLCPMFRKLDDGRMSSRCSHIIGSLVKRYHIIVNAEWPSVIGGAAVGRLGEIFDCGSEGPNVSLEYQRWYVCHVRIVFPA
jgi:hypothetical protein